MHCCKITLAFKEKQPLSALARLVSSVSPLILLSNVSGIVEFFLIREAGSDSGSV